VSLHPPVTSADHTLGPSNAPLTLVEFGDYQCGYCAQAHDIVKSLIAEFGDDLRYVFRNYPLVQIHPYAMGAALAAESAGPEQFWALHDLLYANQDALDADDLIVMAKRCGVSEQAAIDALNGGTQAKIRADVESGDASGLEGTPTFFINGRRHDGDWSLERLSAALRAAAHGR
jgi:protein-disulfide isomerase